MVLCGAGCWAPSHDDAEGESPGRVCRGRLAGSGAREARHIQLGGECILCLPHACAVLQASGLCWDCMVYIMRLYSSVCTAHVPPSDDFIRVLEPLRYAYHSDLQHLEHLSKHLAFIMGRRSSERGVWVLQVRSFLELRDFLLGLELPADTRQAWERFI